MLDYGGQYSQLIARRVRDCGVFSELLPASRAARGDRRGANRAGSSSPAGRRRCTRDGAPRAGARPARAGRAGDGHLLRHAAARARRSAGASSRPRWASSAARSCTSPSRACCCRACRASRPAGCPTATPSIEPPPGFTALASSSGSPVAAVEDAERGIYGIQFHPEVVHTPYGQEILTRFLTEVCGCEPTWSAASIVEEQMRAHPRAGRRRQRDLRALRRRRLLGRRAARAPRGRRAADVRVRRPRPDAQGRGRAGGQRPSATRSRCRSWRSTPRRASSRSCSGVTEPEAKRKAIGAEFIRVFEEEAAQARRARTAAATRASSCRARSTPT